MRSGSLLLSDTLAAWRTAIDTCGDQFNVNTDYLVFVPANNQSSRQTALIRLHYACHEIVARQQLTGRCRQQQV